MEIYVSLLISFILALTLALYEVPIIVRIVKKLHLMDHPNERSSAVSSIPTLGGIAIFISFILASAIGLSRYELPEIRYILPAITLIFFLGLTDDIVNVPPFKKIIVQIAVAAILIFLAKIRITNLHGLFGIWEIGEIPGFLITCFMIILIINSFNLMDGIDGLAAGITMLVAFAFGSWFFISGHYNYAILSITLVGSLGGFFYYNVYGVQNKIFMGDTGSLVLGTIISILLIQFNEFNIDQSQPYALAAAPAISFGILSYPLMDTFRVTMIRIFHLKTPFRADKNHFHHRLLILGLSHKQATFSIIGFNILFILAVFNLNQQGTLKIMAYIIIAIIIIVMIPAFVISKRKLIKTDDPVQQLLIPGAIEEPPGIKMWKSGLKRDESQVKNQITFLKDT
jgi:UDP-N-acetylmuramyl pentapeptide phosphotransferase/UDP-N-acetylglucosamine-1-phosphate transferase